MVDINNIWPGGSATDHVEGDAFPITILPFSPIGIIQEHVGNHRWFEGLVLATSYFEMIGEEKIYEFLNSEGKNVSKEILGRINLKSLIVLLFSHGLINQIDYGKMSALNTYRNNVVHRLEDEIDTVRAENLINDGINCIKNLIEKE
jgi:hypothetical protein